MPQLKERLKALARQESTYPHILSAYLRVRDAGKDRLKEAKIFVKNRVAEIERVLVGDSRAIQGLKAEIAVLERIIEQDIPKDTLGLALFIRGGEVFERFDTRFPFENQIAYRRVPHIAQLAFMDEELEPFLIVSVDSRSAKIFDVALGVVNGEHKEIASEVHRRIHSGGWSQMRFQRRIDNQKREHIEDVATQIRTLVHDFHYKRIMLVGPDKATGQLMEILGPDVRKRVIERAVLDSRATDKEIVEQALLYFAKAESEEEEEKIRRVRIEIHSTRMAVAGIDNVLRCLARGQTYEVLLAHDFNERGIECSSCGAISHGKGLRYDRCPACDADRSHIKDVDLREVITRKALGMNAKLEYVKLPEFREQFGRAAALLHSPST